MSARDVAVTFDGSLFLFRPQTPEGEAWLRSETDGSWFGGALVVEHSYAANLADALTRDGLTVEVP